MTFHDVIHRPLCSVLLCEIDVVGVGCPLWWWTGGVPCGVFCGLWGIHSEVFEDGDEYPWETTFAKIDGRCVWGRLRQGVCEREGSFESGSEGTAKF